MKCLREVDLASASYSSRLERVVIDSALSQFSSSVKVDANGKFQLKSKYFATYSSPYSGAFDLLDTMYVPRPCAQNTVNLTQMDYFYGQRVKTYDIRKENRDKIFAKMDSEREIVFQNGTSSALFANLGTG